MRHALEKVLEYKGTVISTKAYKTKTSDETVYRISGNGFQDGYHLKFKKLDNLKFQDNLLMFKRKIEQNTGITSEGKENILEMFKCLDDGNVGYNAYDVPMPL